MGAVIGYAFMQPPSRYFPIFFGLGFGYALPFTLLSFFPDFLSRHLPKAGPWLTKVRYILAVPVFLTCCWLAWILCHQLGTPRTPSETDFWQPYTAEVLREKIRQKQPVLIDFTAKWCLTCLMNEKTSLSSPAFESYARTHGISLLRADWTNRTPDITRALARYGRQSVPLYVFYPSGEDTDPVILPQILTPSVVLKALQTALEDGSQKID
jgi:thiol:disulfide interchange protein DsbD